MHGFLRLRFQDDNDGTGELFATVECEGFSGQGRAYFDVEHLQGFAIALGTFPLLAEDERLSISSGFGGEAPQEHLGITVRALNARGYIGIQVRVATPLWPSDRPASQKKAQVELITTYEPLSKFAKDFESVLCRKQAEAVLMGQGMS